MTASRSSIVCPIGLFDEVEGKIAAVASAINEASTIGKKAAEAGKMRELVSGLLRCSSYDDGKANCRLCRDFSRLRDEAAALVEQAARSTWKS